MTPLITLRSIDLRRADAPRCNCWNPARDGHQPDCELARRRADFEARVAVTSDCWLWLGTVGSSSGYGRFAHLWAHRVAWELAYGPIPDGLFVCHRCDNPPCVRPDHLFLGTAAENSADMASKGRARNGDPRGERNGRARLTEAAVRAIREQLSQPGANRSEIARHFGVSRSLIRFIEIGVNWSHVAMTDPDCKLRGIRPR